MKISSQSETSARFMQHYLFKKRTAASLYLQVHYSGFKFMCARTPVNGCAICCILYSVCKKQHMSLRRVQSSEIYTQLEQNVFLQTTNGNCSTVKWILETTNIIFCFLADSKTCKIQYPKEIKARIPLHQIQRQVISRIL